MHELGIVFPDKYDVCPITNLPITKRAEWINILNSPPDYSATFFLIGTNILYVRVTGYTDLERGKAYFNFLHKLEKELFPGNQQYILLEDYFYHVGASIQSKNYYVAQALKNKKIKNIFFFNTSSFFKLMINLGKKVTANTDHVYNVENYQMAISKAAQIMHNDLSQDQNAISFVTCNKTNLPIISYHNWTNIDLGEGYSVTFKIIDKNILLTIPKGNNGKKGMLHLLQKREDFLKYVNLYEKHYVEIKDYAYITDHPTKEGREQLINALYDEGKRGKMLGYIGYNSPISVKLIFNVANKLHKAPFYTQIVSNYETAVKQAKTLLKKHTPKQKENDESQPEWYIELDGFSNVYKLLNANTLFFIPDGDFKEKHAEPIIKKYEDVIIESGIHKQDYYYAVSDWTNLTASGWRARKKYIQEFKKATLVYKNCKAYIVFGLNSIMRTVVALNKKFLPIPVIVVDNLSEALDYIERQPLKETTQLIEQKSNIIYPEKNIHEQVENLMYFMGSINWDKEGIQMDHQKSALPIFNPLYEAVALIKADFDTIVEEKTLAEADLEKQNRYNKLRADIWEIAAKKDLSETELIQQLLNRVGPVLGVDRASYHHFTSHDPKRSDITCSIEWHGEDIHPILGIVVPNFIAKHFLHTEPFTLTEKIAIETIPPPLKAAAIPIIKKLAKQANLKEMIVFPHLSKNLHKGFFVFLIAEQNTKVNTIDTDIYLLINEMIDIVSNHITQKEIEKALQASYSEMENKIQERTTSLIQANQELREARVIAEEASHAKSQFLANMSHEIRTPLNVILGIMEIMNDEKNKDQIPLYTNHLTNESKKLLELVTQLLDLSKIESGKMELQLQPFSIEDLINSVMESFRLIAQNKNITFTSTVEENIPVLLGDNIRLKQIISNLIGNALKFTPEGKITINVKKEKSSKTKTTLLFQIIDTGIGIEKDKQKIIFENFTQADSSTTRKYGGTGLGTSISKQFVEMMQGKIGVDSTPNKGSTFWFTAKFKHHNTKTPFKLDHKKKSPDIPKKKFKHARILVVEDYPTSQEVISFHLQSADYIPIIAQNGQVAFDKYMQESLDLILMDIQMPIMDGYTCTKKIRSEHEGKNIPIIALTANAFDSDKQKCLDVGMNDIITKPVEKELLLNKIHYWLSVNKKQLHAIPIPEIKQPDKIKRKSIPIDITSYIERMDNNKEIAYKIIHGFVSRLDDQIKNLEEKIKEKDMESIERQAHSIKGGASNLIAFDVMEAAKKLELAAKANKLKNIPKLLKHLRKECTRLQEYVRQL